jgi:hypothetical protein
MPTFDYAQKTRIVEGESAIYKVFSKNPSNISASWQARTLVLALQASVKRFFYSAALCAPPDRKENGLWQRLSGLKP